MNTELINTIKTYHAIINAPDRATRERLYIDHFVAPWQHMMQVVAGMGGDSDDDPLAGARAWAWLLPDQLTTMSDSLQKLEAAKTWETAAIALAKAAACFAPYADRIGIETLTGWLMLADPERSNPVGRGYTGAIDFTQPQLVVQVDTPNDYTLPRLAGAMVHEMHHLIRLKLFPWDMTRTSVADYIIHEGMAESFAAALFGADIVGYYVTDISDDDLNTAQSLIGAGLDKTGFNVIRGYIFGDTLAQRMKFDSIGMPDYGGYAIGYHVVQAYLQRTGQSMVAATFVPAMQIIEESGYFA